MIGRFKEFVRGFKKGMVNHQLELAQEMAGKSDQELQHISTQQVGWTPTRMNAAKAELQKRGVRIGYQVLADGRKHYLNATGIDVLVSIFLPGWGLLVGGFAFFAKHERKRGGTMMVIGTISLLLVFISGRFNK